MTAAIPFPNNFPKLSHKKKLEDKTVHAVLSINTLKEIIANIENRGFGHENIEDGFATAVLNFTIEEDNILTLRNRGEW